MQHKNYSCQSPPPPPSSFKPKTWVLKSILTFTTLKTNLAIYLQFFPSFLVLWNYRNMLILVVCRASCLQVFSKLTDISLKVVTMQSMCGVAVHELPQLFCENNTISRDWVFTCMLYNKCLLFVTAILVHVIQLDRFIWQSRFQQWLPIRWQQQLRCSWQQLQHISRHRQQDTTSKLYWFCLLHTKMFCRERIKGKSVLSFTVWKQQN